MTDVWSAVDRLREVQDVESQNHVVRTNFIVAITKTWFLREGSLNQSGWCQETEEKTCVLIHSTSGHDTLHSQ